MVNLVEAIERKEYPGADNGAPVAYATADKDILCAVCCIENADRIIDEESGWKLTGAYTVTGNEECRECEGLIRAVETLADLTDEGKRCSVKNATVYVNRQWVPLILSPGDAIAGGDLESAKDGELCEIPYTAYGDYVGGCVERANVRYFLELYGSRGDVHQVLYGFNNRSIVVSSDCADPELLETVKGLADYPLISDETMSEIEREQEQEAIDEYLALDLIGRSPAMDETKETAPEVYRRALDTLAELEFWPDFCHEVGGSVYVSDEDSARIKDACSVRIELTRLEELLDIAAQQAPDQPNPARRR